MCELRAFCLVTIFFWSHYGCARKRRRAGLMKTLQRHRTSACNVLNDGELNSMRQLLSSSEKTEELIRTVPLSTVAFTSQFSTILMFRYLLATCTLNDVLVNVASCGGHQLFQTMSDDLSLLTTVAWGAARH